MTDDIQSDIAALLAECEDKTMHFRADHPIWQHDDDDWNGHTAAKFIPTLVGFDVTLDTTGHTAEAASAIRERIARYAAKVTLLASVDESLERAAVVADEMAAGRLAHAYARSGAASTARAIRALKTGGRT